MCPCLPLYNTPAAVFYISFIFWLVSYPLYFCKSTTSLHASRDAKRLMYMMSWHKRARARGVPFMSMLSVPEGTWSGASGLLPVLHLMRGERGSVPASRSTRAEMFECCSADAKGKSRDTKTCFVW